MQVFSVAQTHKELKVNGALQKRLPQSINICFLNQEQEKNYMPIMWEQNFTCSKKKSGYYVS